MPSLTGANCTFLLAIATIFPAPVQLQGFATDDVTDMDALESTQVMMGVDGLLSGGFVYNEVKQHISLQADSPSNDVFDQWWQAQQANLATYNANGTLVLDTGKKWALTKGFLTSYKPIGAVKKLIQPRSFVVTWQRVQPAPV